MPAPHLTVGALEAFLRDHDVPLDAEVRLRPAGQHETAGISPSWDPHTLVLVLAEAKPE
jgi:hypothetical protein